MEFHGNGAPELNKVPDGRRSTANPTHDLAKFHDDGAQQVNKIAAERSGERWTHRDVVEFHDHGALEVIKIARWAWVNGEPEGSPAAPAACRAICCHGA